MVFIFDFTRRSASDWRAVADDLIRQVREQGHDANDLPAVALTAFAQKNHARLALLAGFQVHVPKPVDPHDLTSVIAKLATRTG